MGISAIVTLEFDSIVASLILFNTRQHSTLVLINYR